jgi:hypothetical protein
MTKESEHYMDHPKVYNYLRPYWIQNPKVHKSLVTSLDPEPAIQDKYITRPVLHRAIPTTYFTKVKHAARFLLAPGP